MKPHTCFEILDHALASLRSKEVRRQAEEVLSSLSLYLPAQLPPTLPVPFGSESEDDGSFSLGWRFPRARFTFCLDPNPDESGWHVVRLGPGGGLATGPVTRECYREVVAQVLRECPPPPPSSP